MFVPSCLCWFSVLSFIPGATRCFMMDLHILSLQGKTGGGDMFLGSSRSLPPPSVGSNSFQVRGVHLGMVIQEFSCGSRKYLMFWLRLPGNPGWPIWPGCVAEPEIWSGLLLHIWFSLFLTWNLWDEVIWAGPAKPNILPPPEKWRRMEKGSRWKVNASLFLCEVLEGQREAKAGSSYLP